MTFPKLDSVELSKKPEDIERDYTKDVADGHRVLKIPTQFFIQFYENKDAAQFREYKHNDA